MCIIQKLLNKSRMQENNPGRCSSKSLFVIEKSGELEVMIGKTAQEHLNETNIDARKNEELLDHMTSN